MKKFLALAMLAGVPGFLQMAAAQSEVRVLCSNSIRAAVVELTPQIEKALGRRMAIEFSASTALKKEIEGGAAFDLAILTPGIAADLAKAGKLAAGSVTNLASSDLGVGVKEGSAKAEVSTEAGMKARLLAAKTLTWTAGGASAGATADMIQALGIEAQVKAKVVLQHMPGHAAESVAEGENELVFAPISEIQTVKGVMVLGLFPQKFQKPVVATAGVGAQAKDAEGARAIVKFLMSEKAAGALKAAGMKPAGKS